MDNINLEEKGIFN